MGMAENFAVCLLSQLLQRLRAGKAGEGTPQGAVLPQGAHEATPHGVQEALGVGRNPRGGEVRGGRLLGDPQELRRDQERQVDQERESP